MNNVGSSWFFFGSEKTASGRNHWRKKLMPTKTNPPAAIIRGAYKAGEACSYLSISKPSLYRCIERGLIVPNRSLRTLRFTKEELDRFLKNGMS
jgi:excisionase family DNA binding protein